MENGRRRANIVQANKIKSLRKERNMTQAELGKMIGVSAQHVGRIENGQRRPSQQCLEDISIALKVPLSYLLRDDSEGIEQIPCTPETVGKIVTETIDNLLTTITALKTELALYKDKRL